TNVAVAAGLNSTGTYADGYGVVWGDYDLDGDFDVFMGGWKFDPLGGGPNTNRLFKNNLVETGTANFTDVSATLGLFATETHGFGGIVADMDGDRYPELLIAGDFGTSKYYENNEDGTFTAEWPMTEPEGQVWNGMGNTLGDFNRDGKPDWFVTAINPAWHGAGP